MAKAVVVSGTDRSGAEQNKLTHSVTGSIERSVDFLKDVRNEMRKVVTPTREEVRSMTAVVIGTVFAFAAYFYVVDQILGRTIQGVLHWLGTGQ